MNRLAVLSLLSLLSITPACAKLGWPKSSSTSAVSAPSVPAAAAPLEPPAPGLSEYATRFIRDTNALAKDCPVGPTPAENYERECVLRGELLEKLHKSVEEKSNAQVKRGFAYVSELRKSIVIWRAADKDKEARDHAAYKTDSAVRKAEHEASGMIKHLKEGRDGKVASPFTSFDQRDAEFVERYVTLMRNREMPLMEEIAKGCTAGAGEKELCDLAVNREKYWTAMLALQLDAILADHFTSWTDEITFMKNEGRAAVVQFNTLTKPEKLKELGQELTEIGKALGQPNPGAKVDGRLAKIHDDYLVAIRDKQKFNAWAKHASHATHQDPAVTRAVRDIKGLSLVRVGAEGPTWSVVRGALDQPVKRERGTWALMKKPGDAFCRLYHFTVIEDHQGGGKYGAGRAESFGEVLFYVSTCK